MAKLIKVALLLSLLAVMAYAQEEQPATEAETETEAGGDGQDGGPRNMMDWECNGIPADLQDKCKEPCKDCAADAGNCGAFDEMCRESLMPSMTYCVDEQPKRDIEACRKNCISCLEENCATWFGLWSFCNPP